LTDLKTGGKLGLVSTSVYIGSMMSEQEKTTGGFAGDLAEAFAPAAGSGCCGSPAGHTDSPEDAGGESSVTPCCGTSEQSQAEGSCCGESAKAEAVASGAGCCG
jgi:hypothetical protein